MSSDYDLSDPISLLSYLSSTPFASTEATPLSGGNANYVFRLHLKEPYEGHKTLALKHGKPYVKGSTIEDYAFDIARQLYEGKSLDRIKRLLDPHAFVTVPALHLHDTSYHALIMDDCGASGGRNVKQLFIDDAASPPNARILTEDMCRKLGAGLGEFIATVHGKGSQDEELMKTCAQNLQGRELSNWCSYGRLVETVIGTASGEGLIHPPLAVSDSDLAVLQEIAKTRSEEILNASDIFTMGDFWTGNIVLDTPPLPNQENSKTPTASQAYVIDWELAKPGLPFNDVGQLAAELHLLRLFHPETSGMVSTCLQAFLETYRGVLNKSDTQGVVRVDDAFVRGVAVHIGAHLVVWTPRIDSWKPPARVREVVQEGLEYLLKGWKGDETWLRGSIVGELLR